MTHQRLRVLLWGVAIVAAVTVALAWLVPSRDYLYVPNTATPVAAKVNVEGEKPSTGAGAIYYVDVSVRRATWAERLLPFLRPDGATLTRREQVVPRGSSFEERANLDLAGADGGGEDESGARALRVSDVDGETIHDAAGDPDLLATEADSDAADDSDSDESPAE